MDVVPSTEKHLLSGCLQATVLTWGQDIPWDGTLLGPPIKVLLFNFAKALSVTVVFLIVQSDQVASRTMASRAVSIGILPMNRE